MVWLPASGRARCGIPSAKVTLPPAFGNRPPGLARRGWPSDCSASVELVKLPFKPALCRNWRGGRRVGCSDSVLAGAGCSMFYYRSLDFSLFVAAEGFLRGMFSYWPFRGSRLR